MVRLGGTVFLRTGAVRTWRTKIEGMIRTKNSQQLTCLLQMHYKAGLLLLPFYRGRDLGAEESRHLSKPGSDGAWIQGPTGDLEAQRHEEMCDGPSAAGGWEL